MTARAGIAAPDFRANVGDVYLGKTLDLGAVEPHDREPGLRDRASYPGKSQVIANGG